MTDNFYGLPTGTINNKTIRLDYLAECGPRIVRLFTADSPVNLFAETPDIKWSTPFVETPYGEYFIRGGHRLWIAPESPLRTYIPDNEGLHVEAMASGVRLTAPTEKPTGIQKRIEINLSPDHPVLTIHHFLQNNSPVSQKLAPWAITQLPLGGMALLPQMVAPLDSDGLQPNRHLVLWPYSRWHDPRLDLQDDILLLFGDPILPPVKIGYMNRVGWVGYYREGIFFMKRFTHLPDREYPDFGCNVECYCNDRFIEVETLGPLCLLEPGQSTEYVEEWELFTLPSIQLSLAGAREISLSLQPHFR